MRKLPEDYADCGECVMSNFDSAIDRAVERQLRTEKVYAGYAGWSFHGYVWFEDGEFHCAVWCAHAHRETISAATLDEIQTDVVAEYGRE